MLQQTQVKTVIPYFERFVTKYPNLEKLSKAKENSVFKIWEGLGYYLRAKNLLKTAKILNKNYSGLLPADIDVLKSFPGIGEYTANAIMAIVHGKPYIPIDSNVKRILIRIWGIESKKNNFKLQSKIEIIKSKNRCKEYAEALMELGALICKPFNPKCDICPVNNHCMAFKNKNFAIIKKKINIKKKKYLAIYKKRKNHILVTKNNSIGFLKKMIMLPMIEVKSFNLNKNKFVIRGEIIKHSISNKSMEIRVVGFKKKINLKNVFWLDIKKIHNFPIPILTKTIFKSIKVFS